MWNREFYTIINSLVVEFGLEFPEEVNSPSLRGEFNYEGNSPNSTTNELIQVLFKLFVIHLTLYLMPTIPISFIMHYRSIFDLHVYMFTSERFRKAKIKLKHVYSRRKSTSHPFRPWAELRRLSVNSRCSANLIYSLSPLTENPSPFQRLSTDLRSLT